MNVEKLAYDLGRRMAKIAYDEEQSNWPITRRLAQHGGIGAGVGALGTTAMMMNAIRKRGVPPGQSRKALLAGSAIAGGLFGGGLGLASGSIHGGYDAGYRTGSQNLDDHPTARAAMAGAVSNPVPGTSSLAMLAALAGRTRGLDDRQNRMG